jgi:hypothetical protein
VSIEELIIDTVRTLPPDKQQEILAFAKSLQQQQNSAGQTPHASLFGFWSGVDVSEDDIAQARQEMWDNFPRDLT